MSIQLQHVSKTFGSFQALHDVSLEVADGELLALLGPSGSGKTTLLRIIAGLDIPDRREETVLRFNGERVDFDAPGQRRVGFVFQHYALFRTMTVFENVAFGLRVRPRRLRPPEQAIRKKVHELLSLIQLESMAGRYPSQLSGGQRQRVALARALAIEPQILLLDEPFGALDAKVRQSLRRWLRSLHAEIHVTSVLVTHDQEEALEVADRVVIMNEGRLEQVGTPDEVFHKPASAFVMDFLGNVNLFHARMDSASGRAAWALGSAEKPARILVRPHDLELSLEENGGQALRGRVVRVQTAGPMVRVEVAGDSGDNAVVELSHERFQELGVKRDDIVYVSMKAPHVFVEDYSI
ncbi:MAG: sulfate/molybdate ABC transporter ATP-binding protein [Acidobacteria bacterium]|nr:sulfate/molybdate ABC transporter ATP-binding protein [Acidobacteriota bacterium]